MNADPVEYFTGLEDVPREGRISLGLRARGQAGERDSEDGDKWFHAQKVRRAATIIEVFTIEVIDPDSPTGQLAIR